MNYPKLAEKVGGMRFLVGAISNLNPRQGTETKQDFPRKLGGVLSFCLYLANFCSNIIVIKFS